MPFIQHASSTATFTSGTTGTAPITFSSVTGAENCLVVCAGIFAPATPSVTSVTTNGTSENWAKAVSDADTVAAIWTNPGTGGGQTVLDVNVTFGGTASASDTVQVFIDAYEFSAMWLAGVVDRTAASADAAGTSWSSGSTAATAQPREILVGMVTNFVDTVNTAGTITGPASPWINEPVLTGSIQNGGTTTASKYFCYQMSGYQPVSVAGAYSYAGTTTPSTANYAALIATLREVPPPSGYLGPRQQAIVTAATR